MTQINELKIGDSVRVKSGTKDPDFGTDLSGYQGRIYEIIKEENLISINWDSITLKQMDSETIRLSEIEGFDWSSMNLSMNDVESIKARDKLKDVESQKNTLETIHRWDHLGDQGKRFNKILENIKDDNSIKALKAWENKFKEDGCFPVDAVVDENIHKGPLKFGDKVKINKISEIVEDSGIIVKVSKKDNDYEYPLCDLKITEKDNPMINLLRDYRDWFSNK